MDALPVASCPVPVDPSAAYEGLPHLAGFEPNISYAGGINKPKILVALDSCGGRHRQLVKSGNDDMRQASGGWRDAVMQQTFALINGLLARDAAAASRGLRIATYRVVPFSPTAGLLQWVEDTQPLNSFLLGKDYLGGAHGKYAAPGEWNWIQCYNRMKLATDRVREGKADTGEMLAAFTEVMARFSPVLHHFLLEAFPHPAAWLAGQSAYAASTAAASIGGYLLGLGDRHSGNILLHGATGAVVHIDLGIAFEQGRFLTTPELVPFRLTRDVVDGLGVNGVEGPFRRCCEETMRVLRSHYESLLTVLEVVLHDPLAKWSLTLAKARQKQPRDRDRGGQQTDRQQREEEQDEDDAAALLGNADAARVLLRVKQKLEGRMDAGVRALLSEAQDPARLCRMYVGWSPWIWYDDNAFTIWGANGPSWEEAKKHSKGMRRLQDIPGYFRNYRRGRKKKAGFSMEDEYVSSDSETNEPDGVTAARKRKPQVRARANNSKQQPADSDAAAQPADAPQPPNRSAAPRARAASTSQITSAAAAMANGTAVGGASGVTLFGLAIPFFGPWRGRSASTPVIAGGEQEGGAQLGSALCHLGQALKQPGSPSHQPEAYGGSAPEGSTGAGAGAGAMLVPLICKPEMQPAGGGGGGGGASIFLQQLQQQQQGRPLPGGLLQTMPPHHHHQQHHHQQQQQQHQPQQACHSRPGSFTAQLGMYDDSGADPGSGSGAAQAPAPAYDEHMGPFSTIQQQMLLQQQEELLAAQVPKMEPLNGVTCAVGPVAGPGGPAGRAHAAHDEAMRWQHAVAAASGAAVADYAAPSMNGGGLGSGAGAGGGTGLPCLDSTSLMAVPSSALPPDMRVNDQRGVLGRLFPRNSTLKMMHSLFNRWSAQQDAADAEAAAEAASAAGEAVARAGSAAAAAPQPPQPPQLQSHTALQRAAAAAVTRAPGYAIGTAVTGAVAPPSQPEPRVFGLPVVTTGAAQMMMVSGTGNGSPQLRAIWRDAPPSAGQWAPESLLQGVVSPPTQAPAADVLLPPPAGLPALALAVGHGGGGGDGAATATAAASGGSPSGGHVDAVGFITMPSPHPLCQQQGYLLPGATPADGYETPSALRKRGRDDDSPASATTGLGQGASLAGGSFSASRKLQRGLSGVFGPLLSWMSVGRRNSAAGVAGGHAASGAAAAATGAPSATPTPSAAGASFEAVAIPRGNRACDAPGKVDAACAAAVADGGAAAARVSVNGTSSVGLGLVLGLGMELPSAGEGAVVGLLSGLNDSRLLDGLPSLAEDMTAAMLAGIEAAAAAGGAAGRRSGGGAGRGASGGGAVGMAAAAAGDMDALRLRSGCGGADAGAGLGAGAGTGMRHGAFRAGDGGEREIAAREAYRFVTLAAPDPAPGEEYGGRCGEGSWPEAAADCSAMQVGLACVQPDGTLPTPFVAPDMQRRVSECRYDGSDTAAGRTTAAGAGFPDGYAAGMDTAPPHHQLQQQWRPALGSEMRTQRYAAGPTSASPAEPLWAAQPPPPSSHMQPPPPKGPIDREERTWEQGIQPPALCAIAAMAAADDAPMRGPMLSRGVSEAPGGAGSLLQRLSTSLSDYFRFLAR
ncbi:hypothetical protein GPECTOR_13g630 [Gonium pectorale]|uniref:non-specific serine/threonine protein kinase n=1 Tax=Gonium pectorale TaxID=33097 RepID=A0A150GMS3_GONPE|nr:hypothetical protein GPECTOR_13g630 [Gonium pectorale]|eukprot:KXZ51143.1 hypothetical protein GPECTOR_13g630 [Gonium pectorale]